MERVHYPNTQFAKDMWAILDAYRYKFAFWYGVRLVTSVILLVIPYAIGKIIDFFTEFTAGEPLGGFYFWLGVIVIATAIAAVLRLTSKYQIGNVSRDARQSVRLRALSTLLGHDLAWHEGENTGNKIERINTGANGVRRFIRFLSEDSTDVLVGIVGVAVVFASIGLKYVAALLLYIVLYLSFEFSMNRLIAQKVHIRNKHSEEVSGKIHEYAVNISTVKSLGLGSSLQRRAQDFESKQSELDRQSHLLGITKWIGIQLISAVFIGAFIYLVGMDVVLGAVTLGSIAVFTTYVMKTRDSLHTISRQSDEVIDAKYAVYRIKPLLEQQKQTRPGTPFPTQWGRIRMHGVSFRYKDRFILQDIALELRKGEKIGLVGASGQGKSTLLKLLLNLYLPTRGKITIDQKSLDGISEEELVQHITIVPQEVELFNTSLRENITVLAERPQSDLQAALAIAACESIVEKLPQGLETMVGEKGVRLSGGERQRIGIARAIYTGADVILLDESTSHLDSETEQLIQERMQKYLKDKTVVLIAHRLSTLIHADRIVVLKDGRIVEEGTYRQLLKKKGEFYKLHKLQNGK